MIRLRRAVDVAVLSAIVLLLAGCASGAPQAVAFERPLAASHAAPAIGGPLIYACEFTAGQCVWYAHGVNQVAGTLSGLSLPAGVGVDASGDVYVANFGAQNVLVYGRGSTTLLRTLDDSGHLPIDVKVNPRGTVFVANYQDTNSTAGSISVFAPGSTTVTRVISDANFGLVTGLALDESDELVACYDNANGGFCDEFPHGRGGHTTTVVSNPGAPGMEGVAFDGIGDLAVQSVLSGTQYFTPTFSSCGTDPMRGEEMYVAFDRADADIYKTNTASYVEEDSYSACSGSTGERRYDAGLDGNVPYGVAIDPSAGR